MHLRQRHWLRQHPRGPVVIDATPDWPEFSEPCLTVYPSDNDPEPALYGPDGDVLLWRQRPVGFRSLNDERL